MKNKGFTLIELLVVIAIIGILSSVVLASLTTARTRGQAASVQSQLSNMRAQAELYYSTTGANKYATADVTTCTAASSLFAVDAANGLDKLMAGIVGPTGASSVTDTTKISCEAGVSAWAVAAINPAVSGGTEAYCVDSKGTSKTKTVTANTPSGAITSAACN